MKNLKLTALLIIGLVGTANVKAQVSQGFQKELSSFVDSVVKSVNPDLEKTEKFDCKSHVLTKRFGYPEAPYSENKAFLYKVTAYGKDSKGTEAKNPEIYGLDVIKNLYLGSVKKCLMENQEEKFDSYDFEVVQIDQSYFLVMALGYKNPIDTKEELEDAFKKAMAQE